MQGLRPAAASVCLVWGLLQAVHAGYGACCRQYMPGLSMNKPGVSYCLLCPLLEKNYRNNNFNEEVLYYVLYIPKV